MKVFVVLPMILQSFSFILLKKGPWRNICSKTLRAKEWKKNGTREREREENQVA
jgi:hypothetical protein